MTVDSGMEALNCVVCEILRKRFFFSLKRIQYLCFNTFRIFYEKPTQLLCRQLVITNKPIQRITKGNGSETNSVFGVEVNFQRRFKCWKIMLALNYLTYYS